jgi:hypothetical protein
MYFLKSYVTLITLTIIINVLFLLQSRDIVPSIYATVADQQENTNSTLNIPPVKLKYANRTYDMLPFVVVDEDGVRKLNFPRLADEYKPLIQISSGTPFGFEFKNKPREVNAFGIDYDADTTEVYPLNKIGKYQFNSGKLDGIFTVEVRAIYDDGKYVTYTGLVKIDNPEVGQRDLYQQSPGSNQSALPNIFS